MLAQIERKLGLYARQRCLRLDDLRCEAVQIFQPVAERGSIPDAEKLAGALRMKVSLPFPEVFVTK